MAIKIVFVIFAENKREVRKSEKIEARRTNLYVFVLCFLFFVLCSLLFVPCSFIYQSLLFYLCSLLLKKTQL